MRQIVMRRLEPDHLAELTRRTVATYDASAESFWQATKDHDVGQSCRALLEAIALESHPPFTILDLGCGPGRDLVHFASLGHHAVGLDAAASFVQMARERSGCEVLQQDFLHLDLSSSRFHGIFANASLFHVPRQELPRVLRELRESLRPSGVLFTSNPHGDNREGWSRDRYGCWLDHETWKGIVEAAGFVELHHFYRPPGVPREQQPWLASVYRRTR